MIAGEDMSLYLGSNYSTSFSPGESHPLLNRSQGSKGGSGMTIPLTVRRLSGYLSLFAFVLTLSLAPQVQAVEQAREFLDALREHRYYDEATAYLDSLTNSPLVPVDFKETLLYERGLTLVEGAKYNRNTSLREKDLNQAQESLKQFLADHADHLYAMAARSQMGNVTVERGRMLVERAKKQADKRDELLAQARPQFEAAIKVFRELREELKVKLEGLPPIPETLDAKSEKNKQLVKARDQRDRWRSDYLQAQLLSAAATEELADAFKPGSKEHTDTLLVAAKEYGEIHDKYRRKGAGIYARQYQARCLLKLEGQKDKKHITDALTYLGEILGEPDEPTIRRIKMSSYEMATKAWLQAEMYAEAFLKGGAWIEDARPNENKEPELQQIRVNVAEAVLKYAADLKKKDPASKDARQALAKGRDFVKDAMKYGDNAIKKKAGELLPQFGGAAVAATDNAAEGDKVPKNYQEAKEFGKEALESLTAAQQIIKLYTPRIKAETDQKVREELERDLEEAKKTLATAKPRALRYFLIALHKAPADTSDDDLNAVRYYLCFLEYDAGNYYNSLTYGQFLATRYPNSAGAKQGALIAMASCQKLYAEEKVPENRDFESQRILKIAQYIVEKWPEEKEAEEALNTLIPFLIKAGRLDDAEKYVAQIPETSAYRGMAELKTGQALWANYLIGMRDVRELEANLEDWKKEGFPADRTEASVKADMAKLKEPLDTLKKRAQQTLIDGVKRMQAAGDVNAIVASASLSLAQIYVDTNQPAAAVALLEDPKIGALTLVTKKDDSVSREGFAEEVYKTALRAYISSLAASKNADETVTKAKGVMAGLKERMGTTPEGEQKLIQNYVAVAKDLQNQLELATDAATKANLAKGFEEFLKQVGAQANDFQILNWVGETFRRMGAAFHPDKSKRPSKEAIAYYKESIKTYENLLDKAEKDPKFMPNPKVKPALIEQLAIAYRDVGQFADAAKKFREILAANPGLIGVQMEAAYTYQAWAGYDDSTTKYYNTAVMGFTDKKTNKLIIWGWKPLSDKIAGDSRFTQKFYEARYNLAVCRFKYALSLDSKDPNRKKLVDMARLDVELTAKLFPDLGGDQWRPKFDVLLKNIQKEAGDKLPKGLAAIDFGTQPADQKQGTN
jgi:tetratricopeptide (TPR) repeat protein